MDKTTLRANSPEEGSLSLGLDVLGGGGDTELVGRFSFHVPTATWTWSPAMFRLHGFQPSEVVPTTDLMAHHVHRDDRVACHPMADPSRWASPFSAQYRIRTAQGDTRRVLTVGVPVIDRLGEVLELRGQMIDLTRAAHEVLRVDLSTAVKDFRDHAAVIEQAKGVLIQVMSLSADEALEVLCHLSQDANLKIRHVAARIIELAPADRTPAKHASAWELTAFLDIVRGWPQDAPFQHAFSRAVAQ